MENQNLEQLQEVWNKVEFPSKLRCLFEPNRYKVLYGGRGGAKSWGIARALLVIGSKKPVRILCAREFMTSMKDSVHKLLSDQIDSLGLGFFYEVTQNAIRGKNGTEIAFVGLRNNVANVKSYEGVDVCWVEEAQSVSKSSWNVLIPTIRKEASEIWITFNPELETDETYQRFVVAPPENCKIAKINWNDNPWFPDTLRLEKDALFSRDREAYNNVWEGLCRQTIDGAIFAKEMTMADLDGRIANVPYDPIKPVHAVFDLGWADATAIWFVQFIAQEVRLIRYYENNQETIAHYLAKMQSYGYVYDTIWLPHDAGKADGGDARRLHRHRPGPPPQSPHRRGLPLASLSRQLQRDQTAAQRRRDRPPRRLGFAAGLVDFCLLVAREGHLSLSFVGRGLYGPQVAASMGKFLRLASPSKGLAERLYWSGRETDYGDKRRVA